MVILYDIGGISTVFSFPHHVEETNWKVLGGQKKSLQLNALAYACQDFSCK